MSTKQRKAEQQLVLDLVNAKDRAGRLGLLRTMHAIDEATRAIGWELAERYEKEGTHAVGGRNRRSPRGSRGAVG